MSMFVLEETSVAADGAGPSFQLGGQRGILLILTLGVTSIVEREGIQISVWGSVDGANWGLTPLTLFTPKYYCGIYSAPLNLASRPDIRYLRVHWHLIGSRNKFVHSSTCGFYVSAAASGSRLSAVA